MAEPYTHTLCEREMKTHYPLHRNMYPIYGAKDEKWTKWSEHFASQAHAVYVEAREIDGRKECRNLEGQPADDGCVLWPSQLSRSS